MGESKSDEDIVIRVGKRKCPPISETLSVPVAFKVNGAATIVASVISTALTERDRLYAAAETKLIKDAKNWLAGRPIAKGTGEDNGSITIGPFLRRG